MGKFEQYSVALIHKECDIYVMLYMGLAAKETRALHVHSQMAVV